MAEEEPPSDMTMIGSPLANAGGTTPKLFGQNDPVGGREFTLQAMTQVGRDPRNVAIYVNHPSISRVHGRITKEGGTWTVEDLQSSNGVFINDSRIQKGFLNDGDEVRFGDVKFQFKLVADEVAGGKERKTMVQRLSDMTIFGGEVPKLFAEEIKQEQEAEAQSTTASDGTKKATPDSYQKQLSQKYFWVKIKVAVAALLFLAVVGGGIFFLADSVAATRKAKVMVKEFTGELGDFVKTNESNVFSDDQQKVEFKGQLAQLTKLKENGDERLKEFPGLSTELTADMTKAFDDIRILKFERELALAVLGKDNKQVESLLKDLEEKGTSAQKAIVPLTKLIAQFRVFKNSYDEPSNAKISPDKDAVKVLMDSRKELTSQYGNHSSYLEIEAKQLGQMAKVALNSDANFAKNWASFWAEIDSYNEESNESQKKELLDKLKAEFPEVDVVKELK